jgi:5,10-methylene-tetrahydrofolate dehydrogenase/methenyl tetrahydrofolate cyclohydrolase
MIEPKNGANRIMINQSAFTGKPMLLFLEMWYTAANINASQSMAVTMIMIAIWLLST